MILRAVPRFSPGLEPREILAALARLARKEQVDGADEEVRRFEAELAEAVGVAHAVMVPSARSGFSWILQAWGLEPGDEVILPALTYWAIPAAVVALGLRPVFADIGLRTHVLDPEAVEAVVTPRSRVVVPTHLFGTPCDMDAIRAVAERHGLRVVEDVAQALGARWRGQRVGSLGDAAYGTFGLTKNITTLSGGAVLTDDGALADRVRQQVADLPHRGRPEVLKDVLTGVAMRLATDRRVYPWAVHPWVRLGGALGRDPIDTAFGETPALPSGPPGGARPRAAQAAVGRLQLRRMDRLNGARSRNGRFLDEHLAHVADLELPEVPEGAEPIYMSYVVHHPRRDALAAELRRLGVDTTVGFMSDCTTLDFVPAPQAPCPNAAEAVARMLHLPVHPGLRDRDLRWIVEAVRRARLAVGSG